MKNISIIILNTSTLICSFHKLFMEKIKKLVFFEDNIEYNDKENLIIQIPNMYGSYIIYFPQNFYVNKTEFTQFIKDIFTINCSNGYFDNCLNCMLRIHYNLKDRYYFYHKENNNLYVMFINIIRYCIVQPQISLLLNNISKIKQEEIDSLEHTIIQSGTNCPICLEDMTQCIKLPCKHCFHKECCTKWLNNNASCPTCRMNIKENLPK